MEILFDLLSIFILGLAGGANPGPILASSFAESLRRGFIKSLRIILMAVIAECIVAALILFLFFSFPIPQIVFYIISLAGSIVLIWLATQVWKIESIDEKKEIFTFGKIFTITLFNGPFWIFWMTVCVPQAFLLGKKIPLGNLTFLLIFVLGWFSSTTLLTFLFSRFRGFFEKTNHFHTVMKIITLILLSFAAKLIYQSIIFLF